MVAKTTNSKEISTMTLVFTIETDIDDEFSHAKKLQRVLLKAMFSNVIAKIPKAVIWRNRIRLSPRIYFSTYARAMNIHVNLSIKDDIGVIRLISPGKVNVLNKGLLTEMQQIMSDIENNAAIKGSIIISDKPDCFIAGADINMLTSCSSAEELERLSRLCKDILNRLHDSKKPVVSAIMGICLGGGAEVALACDYRMAVRYKTTIGFPEVLLGLLPGGGGTQRLPKLIGVPDALDLMLTGKNVRAEKAKKLGLIDQILDPPGLDLSPEVNRTLEYLEEVAIQTARELANGNIALNKKISFFNKMKELAMNVKYIKDYIFSQAKKKVLKQTSGLYPAPLKILEVVRKGLDHGDEVGYREESKAFGELAMSSESKGLISLFYGQTECKKNKVGKPRNQVTGIGILGAGLMGSGIAQVSVENGFTVILKDRTDDALLKGENHVENGINTAVKKKKMSKLEGDRIFSNIISTCDYTKFKDVDLVIECVFEEIDLKRKVLKEVESVIGEDCVYATNTSAISVTKIAEFSKRQDKIVGMHYFSPVEKMSLLEVITTENTSEETIKAVIDVGLKQGKIPIIVKDSPGFFTSRVVFAYNTEFFRLVLEDTGFKRLDELTIKFGFPIGISTLADEIGFDVGYHVYLYFVEKFGDRMRTVDPNLFLDVLKAGYLGRKSGKGCYLYNTSSKEREVNEELVKIIKRYFVPPKVPLTDENIQMRLVMRFVNEAVLCLEEGIISNPLEADIASVFGLGFPPFTGGPCHFVDSFGADRIVAKLRVFEESYGPTFTPCNLLLDHAADKSKRFFPVI